MSSQNKLKKSNITNKISKLRDFDEPSSKFKFIIDLIKKKYNPTFIDCIFSLFLSRNKKIIFQQLSEKISIKSKNFERFFIFQRGNDKIKLRIIPDFIYDIPIDLERIIFKNKSNLIFGSFSSIYLEYYNKNAITKIKRDIIFKEILYKSSEYNGLIFNFLLQQYYINNPHLCIIREFGIIPVTESFETIKYYGILDNCGKDLLSIDEYLINYNFVKNREIDIVLVLDIIIDIFRECLMSIKLIHDVDYLHLDIKPENFLFSRVRNNIEIKIIDFGMIKKCNFTTFNPFGSIEYLPNDWIKNFSENPPRETILQKHHDIFSLGCTFIKIIYFILNYIIFTYFKRNIKIPELCCPTVFREISDKKKCKKRGEYSFNGNPDHPQNPMKEINEIFKKIITTRSNNIFREIKQLSDIICKMCNSIPTERYQSIDEIIVDFKFTKSLRRNNNKWE